MATSPASTIQPSTTELGTVQAGYRGERKQSNDNQRTPYFAATAGALLPIQAAVGAARQIGA
jgi:hypothetical protein